MSVLRSVLKIFTAIVMALGFAAGVSAQHTPRLEVMPQGIQFPYAGSFNLFAGGVYVTVQCYGYHMPSVCYVTPELAWILQSRGVYVYGVPPVYVPPPPPVYYPPYATPPGIYIPFPQGGGVVIPLPHRHHRHGHHGR